ncbi:hypothetical protein SAMN03159353_105216 [Cedecea sp. NFIX57]|nr:hypothetical protein SAMN03159353_105216 [Cedecea sp. NFIX57]
MPGLWTEPMAQFRGNRQNHRMFAFRKAGAAEDNERMTKISAFGLARRLIMSYFIALL